MFGVRHSFTYFVFLKSAGVGYLLGLLYLLFQFLRLIGLSQSVAVFIQDVLYFCLSAVIVFLFVFEVNSGVFRFYILVGILMGFVLFRCVPGAAAERFLRRSVQAIREGARRVFRRKKEKTKAQNQ